MKRTKPPIKLCECGCGEIIKNEGVRFIKGHGNRGRIHSEEHRKKNSNAHKGTSSPMKGRHHTEETKEKLRVANTGKKRTQEFKDNLSNLWKGHPGYWKEVKRGPYSKEHCENISKGLKNSEKQKESVRRNMEKRECNFPHKGKNEVAFFATLRKTAPFSIREDHILSGFIVDGFVEEKNVAIEFDEDYHFSKGQCERDYSRMGRIAADKGVRFVRVAEKDWIKNNQIVCEFVIENVMKSGGENVLVTQKIDSL